MKKLLFLILTVYSHFLFAQNQEEKIYMNGEVDTPAVMCGGSSELMKYIGMIPFNEVTKEDIIVPRKRICIKFIIEKDGSLSTFVPCKGEESIFEKCIIEGLKKCPKWEAAVHQGELVRALFTLPISCLKFEF